MLIITEVMGIQFIKLFYFYVCFHNKKYLTMAVFPSFEFQFRKHLFSENYPMLKGTSHFSFLQQKSCLPQFRSIKMFVSCIYCLSPARVNTQQGDRTHAEPSTASDPE